MMNKRWLLAALVCSGCAQDFGGADQVTASDESVESEEVRVKDPGGLWAPCQPAWQLKFSFMSTIGEPTGGGFTNGCQPGLECIAVSGTNGVCTRLCETIKVRRCGFLTITYEPNPDGRAACAAYGGTCRQRPFATYVCAQTNSLSFVHETDCER